MMKRCLWASVVGLLFAGVGSLAVCATNPETRPNIVWITCEDLGLRFGCYGDATARTPTIDKLASEGVTYDHAFATSGVCAPARSCLITGRYPSTLGSHFMRCTSRLPNGMQFFTHHLREAGYFCTNRSKTDYNLAAPSGKPWDMSNGKAHWRQRTDKNQPFFSVFNFTVTHESKIRANEETFNKLTKSVATKHDPAVMRVPAYYPDTPAVRRDQARLSDLASAMDLQVANVLKELEEDGLADNTIVFFYSDHGDGLPRSKRWLYDSGVNVPLIIRFPPSLKDLAPSSPGSRTDRLVSFVDFGPTVLSLVGVDVPETMHGRPFLGGQVTPPRDYVYGIRDRMDERYDLVRMVRDKRFKYLRNYRSDLPYAQNLDYMEHMPTMKELRRLAEAGQLEGSAGQFMQPRKPVEELYDTEADPDEVNNLADDPAYAEVLNRMRLAHVEWRTRTRDLGYFPEPMLRRLTESTTPYEFGADPANRARIDNLAAIADEASSGTMSLERTIELLSSTDPAVQFWGAVAIGHLDGVSEHEGLHQALRDALGSHSPSVRVAVAGRLCDLGHFMDGMIVLGSELTSTDEWVRLMAAIGLDHLDDQATFLKSLMTKAKDDQNKYVTRVLQKALRDLD